MHLQTMTIASAAAAIRQRKISAREATVYFLDRIKELDPKLNSYVTINDGAIAEAEALDQRMANGEDVGPLAGIPFSLKDLICTRGIRTTAASKMLQNFVPPYDATVASRLKAAGAILLGKVNLDEFAMGSSNETSIFGPVRNPWNTDYVPGGSSGGSSASVAARLCMASVGTDTGGSVRQPSNLCGVVGIKPTYGRISRYGIVAYASSLDQAGPITKTVEDAALLLEVLCGKDPRDGTSASEPVPRFSQNLKRGVKGLRIGIQRENQTRASLNPDVAKAFEEAQQALKSAGAVIVDVSIPLNEFAVPIYYLIAASEASSNLARYDGVKYGYRADFANLAGTSLVDFYSRTRGEGFGTEVKRRIILGTYCLSAGYYDAYYNKACQVRRLLQSQYVDTLKTCDAILSPVTTAPAFKIGSRIADPIAMYYNDVFTVSSNLAGLPAMSVPFSHSNDGLPIGVQLIGRHFDEQTILNIGAALEEKAPGKGRVPSVF